MALFGNFKHIPLTELIPALVKRTGALRVFTREGTFALEVNQGVLVWAYRDRELLGLERAKEMLLELTRVQEAAFEFVGKDVPPSAQGVNYFIPNMMVDLVAIAEARPTYAEQFIDPATRFKLTGKEGYPPGDVGRFLHRTHHLLDSPMGVSSAEVSDYLRIPSEVVFYNMYSLRQMGHIAAVEAFRVAPATPAAVEAQVERKSLAQQILSALRVRLGRSPSA